MLEIPSLAKVVGLHQPVYATFSQNYVCTCDEWADTDRRNNGHLTHGEHVQAVWRELRTMKTVEQLDALPGGTVVELRGKLYRRQPDSLWWLDLDMPLFEESGCVLAPALLVWHPEWSA